ncbi:MAG: YbjN domain-containing protein [Actinomycetota bacterium]|nr:YbjN domain-containing protein [Actinomycetota bacterium]
MGPPAAVDAWFEAHPELPVERSAPGRWATVLQGEHKRGIGVHLSLGEDRLVVWSHFVQAPDENEAAFFGYLLRRNLRTYVLRFAVDDAGDVVLVGLLPAGAVTVDGLDTLMGQLLVAADEAFDTALRLGFATYIDAEQAWRARGGLAPNPITAGEERRIP